MINALYIPANPHRYPSIVQLEGADDPQVMMLLGDKPCTPARYDSDAVLLMPARRFLRGDPLNEVATEWVREHSAAAKTFRESPESEVMTGNALFLGYSERSSEGYTWCDVPERIRSFAMSVDHDELVDNYRARMVAMRNERTVNRYDPVARASDFAVEL